MPDATKKEKIVKILEKDLPKQSEQMSLFELLDPQERIYSNSIQFYDSIPRYVYTDAKKEINEKNAEERREFVIDGASHEVSIRPATLADKNGTNKFFYPSQREELIEKVLRKMAVEGKGRLIDGLLVVVFSLYAIQKELQRLGHGYDINQIKEAISVCAGSSLSVKSQGEKKERGLGTIFSLYELVDRDEWKEQGGDRLAWVAFNPYVANGIMNGNYRVFNYDRNLSYKQFIARRIHDRLSTKFKQASPMEPYTIWASTIMRDFGMKKGYSRLRDAFRQIKKSLDTMVEKGDIAKVEIVESAYGSRKNQVLDIKFKLWPSMTFTREMKFFNKKASEIKSQLFDNKPLLKGGVNGTGFRKMGN
jgi:hypothetical protein